MPICPCCRQSLVRQATQNRVYWFCRDCRQAMPTLMIRPGLDGHDRCATHPLTAASAVD